MTGADLRHRSGQLVSQIVLYQLPHGQGRATSFDCSYKASLQEAYSSLPSSSAMRARASFLHMGGPSCPERRIHQRFLLQWAALSVPPWLAVRPRHTPGQEPCAGDSCPGADGGDYWSSMMQPELPAPSLFVIQLPSRCVFDAIPFFGPLGIVESLQRAYQVAGDSSHALERHALAALFCRWLAFHTGLQIKGSAAPGAVAARRVRSRRRCGNGLSATRTAHPPDGRASCVCHTDASASSGRTAFRPPRPQAGPGP